MQAEITNGAGREGLSFPFKLEDLVSWTVKRTDGSVTKFTLTDAPAEITGGSRKSSTSTYPKVEEVLPSRVSHRLSDYCDHTPKNPIAEFSAAERPEGALNLYVGDAVGARTTKDEFDFVIDGGDVISAWGKESKLLSGDAEMISCLKPYTVEFSAVRLLKIDWWDRKAPDVIPEFWTQLNSILHGDVMTCCQGGHGRSGTSFVCLLLNNAPDYDAMDAIVHLRAVHCPRAIESVVQHEYINDVAKFLEREPNALAVQKVKNYKEAFLASERPTAIRTRKALGWEK